MLGECRFFLEKVLDPAVVVFAGRALLVVRFAGRNSTYNPLGNAKGGGDKFSQYDPHGTIENGIFEPNECSSPFINSAFSLWQCGFGSSCS